MRMRLDLLALALVALGGQPTLACSIVSSPMTRAQVEQYAREQFSKASAIVDAEVTTPMLFGEAWKPGLTPAAFLEVIKRYKGKKRFLNADVFQLIYAEGCDVALVRKGERVRILLTDGPEMFRALQMSNGPPTGRESAQAEFNAEIDRLVGSPRLPGYAVFPGDEPAPPSTKEETQPVAVANTDEAVQRRPIAVKDLYPLGLLIALFIGALFLRIRDR